MNGQQSHRHRRPDGRGVVLNLHYRRYDMFKLTDDRALHNPASNGHSRLGVARALAKQRAASEANVVIAKASRLAERTRRAAAEREADDRKPNAGLIDYFVKEYYEQHAALLFKGVEIRISKWNVDG